MNTNSYKLLRDIDFLLDKVRTDRFDNIDYARAINRAIRKVVDSRYYEYESMGIKSFEHFQRVRDELYSIVKVDNAIAVTAGVITLPTDYLYFGLLQVTSDGNLEYAEMISHNELGDIDNNPFRKPAADCVKVYMDERGLVVDSGSGTLGATATLTYIKVPTEVFIDADANAIASPGPLATNTNYAVDTSTAVVHDGTTYEEESGFDSGAVTAISGGSVLKVINSDLPEALADEVVDKAAAIMSGTLEDVNQYQLHENEGKTS